MLTLSLVIDEAVVFVGVDVVWGLAGELCLGRWKIG